MKRTGVAAPPLPALRAPLVFGALLFLFALLLARSLYLQRVDNSFLQAQGSSRYSRDLEVPAHRGRIVDRLGDPLAISTPVKAVWAWPDKIEATPEQLRALAAALEMPPAELTRRIAAAGDFVYLKRPVAPDVAERIAAMQIKGIHDETEYWRYYPGGDVMSQIVGFTGDRDVGQEGMELAQQSWLGGKPGNRRVIINRRGDIVEDVASIRAPQEGRDLALSIDSRLQYLAYRELKAAIELNKAQAGAIAVLDAQTGEIVALANWPVYNPNNRARTVRNKMRNRALTDTFEPGSSMKPFTIAAALDAGKITPSTLIDTAPGTLTIGGATIHDAHREGTLTVEQVIQKSSNVGAAKIALSLPPATMWQTLVRGRLRDAAAHRVSRRGGRTPAPGQELAAHRAGDHRLRTRHLGQPSAAGACLHRIHQRRRIEAGIVAQGRRRRRGTAGDHAGNRARSAPHAGNGRASRWNGAEGAGRGLSRRRQDRDRAQARRD